MAYDVVTITPEVSIDCWHVLCNGAI